MALFVQHAVGATFGAFDLLRHAQADVTMAEAKLATFREVDKPNRVAAQTLGLQTARDRAQEAADELAQVEIMYAEQDLNDMTREFVIQRERRAADLSYG